MYLLKSECDHESLSGANLWLELSSLSELISDSLLYIGGCRVDNLWPYDNTLECDIEVDKFSNMTITVASREPHVVCHSTVCSLWEHTSKKYQNPHYWPGELPTQRVLQGPVLPRSFHLMMPSCHRWFNWLAPGRCSCNPKFVIFKLKSRINILSISSRIALMWMLQNFTYD